MKLDPTVMRTMSGQDFRVLEAVEKGMQKHALVPSPLIASLACLRHGGTGKILNSLLRDKLLSHDKSCGYDGYRITNAGYDILALHSLKVQHKLIVAMGDKIGTGKESDIYLAVHPNGQQVVLKFHRLGRTSFRNVKKTRDYFVYNPHYHKHKSNNNNNNNQANSWLFLSRKSAQKEYAFMKALWNVGLPTPNPLGHNRHVVVMSLVRGLPLYQIRSQHLTCEQAESIFQQATSLAVRLATIHGLVHCDLNEFNLLVDLSGIQQVHMSQEHDPYVRHSGLSVTAESTPGMLSSRGPWEQQQQHQEQQKLDQWNMEPTMTTIIYNDNHHNNDNITTTVDNDNDSHNEPSPPKPLEYLENGQAKPIVTLIDFPQMVSTEHPNAKELYERDMTCLVKFFSHKLQFQIPELPTISSSSKKTTEATTTSNTNTIQNKDPYGLTWAFVQEKISKMKSKTVIASDNVDDNKDDTTKDNHDHDENEDDVDTNKSVCLASKAQLRLDQQLKASGYSAEDANRDLELYYYYHDTAKTNDPQDDVDEDDDDDDNQEEHDAEEVVDEPKDNNDNENENDNDEEENDNGIVNSDEEIIEDKELNDEQHLVVEDPSSIMLVEQQQLSREQLQEQARLRVQQQLDLQKKKQRQRGAFRKRNSNKTFVKGKRVFQDVVGI